MKIYNSKKEVNILFIILLVGIVFVFWSSTMDTPYWWDSAGYIVHAARYYLETNFSSIFLPSDSAISDFAHPPFFVISLALVWKFFGESLLVSHLFYLPFIFLAIIFTYLLGKEIANFKDENINYLVGFSSALALLFSPVFLAQTGIIYPEIPITAFSVMAVYFFITKRPWGYIASASLALFSKESSIVVVLAILVSMIIQFLFNFLKGHRGEFGALVKKLFFYSTPIFLLIIWFELHKLATGWMFVMPEFQGRFTLDSFNFQRITLTFNFFFWDQGRAILTLFITGCLFFSIFKSKLRKKLLELKNIIPIFLIIIFVPSFFGILEFLHRYIVFGLPFLYIIFFVLFGHALPSGRMFFMLMVLIILVLMFAGRWDDHREIDNWHFPPLEENLEYLDVIEIGQQMSMFVQEEYPEAVVYTSFPTNYMLREPFQHYITKKIEVYDCNQYKSGNKIDLIVFHFLSPRSVNCLQLMRSLGFSNVVKVFEKNGKEIRIYEQGDAVFTGLVKKTDLPPAPPALPAGALCPPVLPSTTLPSPPSPVPLMCLPGV